MKIWLISVVVALVATATAFACTPPVPAPSKKEISEMVFRTSVNSRSDFQVDASEYWPVSSIGPPPSPEELAQQRGDQEKIDAFLAEIEFEKTNNTVLRIFVTFAILFLPRCLYLEYKSLSKASRSA